MKKFFLYLFFLPVCLSAWAHPEEERYRVIIDTDGAADDLRAICMLLSRPEIRVLAIVSSEGALLPEETAGKIHCLLSELKREEIPVGTGRTLENPAPGWRRQSQLIKWGEDSPEKAPLFKSAKELIRKKLSESNENVLYICLGSFTNLHDVVTETPDISGKIQKVLWYNDHQKFIQGANYQADSKAAEKILQSGMEIAVISAQPHPIPVNKEYIDNIRDIHTPYVQKIIQTHTEGILEPVVASAHMHAWDDLIPVYLFYPELFTVLPEKERITIYFLENNEAVSNAHKKIKELLETK
ncbi:MAG: nucleoside hydrolase [Candidatus Azobacteroides sp.]|nr:nucleoside hydrolase [Candidatus Azobacteroides sp.]